MRRRSLRRHRKPPSNSKFIGGRRVEGGPTCNLPARFLRVWLRFGSIKSATPFAIAGRDGLRTGAFSAFARDLPWHPSADMPTLQLRRAERNADNPF
jgi:hypothetical protein